MPGTALARLAPDGTLENARLAAEAYARRAYRAGVRRAAIRYLHFIAGCPVPTAEAQVSETMAGIRRAAADADAGELPASCAKSWPRSATT